MCIHGHYVPKISYELIQEMYRKAKEHQIRMTTLVDILIREGLKNGNIALALETRPERKKAKNFNKIHDRRTSDSP
ncbi:MAG: hypothetical protein HY787_18735 [Deltaproteobacteria bacterium]|nr:hypothetical protein [Deltaproteobacteria bacterium]